MNTIKLFLLVYIFSYLALIFFWRIYITWKKTGSNPIKYGAEDSAHNFIGKIFIMLLGFSIGTALIYIFFEEFYNLLIPINSLELPFLSIFGFIISWLSLLWVFVGQSQMGADWRIGVDKDKKIKRINKGIFGFSRHPIYLGVITTSFSLFLIMPNIINLFLFITTSLILNIQARLEEEYLLQKKKKEYTEYKSKTPRWL